MHPSREQKRESVWDYPRPPRVEPSSWVIFDTRGTNSMSSVIHNLLAGATADIKDIATVIHSGKSCNICSQIFQQRIH